MKYFYLKDDEKIGPLSIDDLSDSDVNKDTLVWFEGLEDWTSMSEIEELKSVLEMKPPPIPIVPPPVPEVKLNLKSTEKLKASEANLKAIIYLDENGITIKASENAFFGEEYELNGEKYKVVDEKMLREMVKNEEDVTRVVTSHITDMKNLFNWVTSFNQNIDSWDTSNVTDMQGMFSVATSFNQDISNWDVENVDSMRGMFSGASSFNRDIKNWNVSNVINMSEMFNGADAFNQDISSWDVSNVLNMNLMFANTKAFNQDLSSWNVKKETTQADIFKNTKSFKQDISKWDNWDSNKINKVDKDKNAPFLFCGWFLSCLFFALYPYSTNSPFWMNLFVMCTLGLIPTVFISMIFRKISFAKILICTQLIVWILVMIGELSLSQN